MFYFSFFQVLRLFFISYRGRNQPEFFWGVKENYGGAKFFVYSDEKDGIQCLYQYYIRILIIINRSVFYEFIMGNKHEVLGFKTKLWRSEGGAPIFGDFCSFLN